MRRPALLLGAAALLAGCAPLGPYAGPSPVTGVPGTTATNTLAPATRDPGTMRYGALGADPSGRRTVLIYGDNRPGFRMQSQRWEYHSVKRIGAAPPMSLLRGLVALPLALVETIVPTLNGPRDLVTAFTQRPTGGGEMRVVRALEREAGADLVISTGDVVTDGRRGRLWADFAKRSRALRERVPYLAAPGNHERVDDPNGAASWEATVLPALAPGRYWGWVDDPATGALWVFLDSNVLTDPRGRRDPERRRAESLAQLAWADSVLARPARLKFVVLHHPLVSAGHYARDWNREGEGQAAENRRRLFAMFLERGVNAVFAGHEHLYQRLWVRGPAGRGFWHVTTGGGGSPLYPVDRAVREQVWSARLPGECAVDRTSVAIRTEYHYGRIELSAADSGAPSAPMVVSRVTLGGGAVPFDSLDLAHPPAADQGGSR